MYQILLDIWDFGVCAKKKCVHDLEHFILGMERLMGRAPLVEGIMKRMWGDMAFGIWGQSILDFCIWHLVFGRSVFWISGRRRSLHYEEP